MVSLIFKGFPDSSVGKIATCNAGDTGSIPGLRSSPGEGIGYPLQHSWASLVAQLVKHPPATWETWVLSLGWEDLLEKGKATHSSILAWRISQTVYSPWGHKESDHDWVTFTSLIFNVDENCQGPPGRQLLVCCLHLTREGRTFPLHSN